MKRSWLKKACQTWQICYKGKTYCSQIFKDVKIRLVWNILKPSKSFTKLETVELGCGVADGCNVRQKIGKTLNSNHTTTLTRANLQWLLQHFFFLILIIIRSNFFFLFIGQEPTTWLANNCIQIMICSCAMPSNCVWLQIIFCTCIKETVPFSLLWSLLRENGWSLCFPRIFI